MVDVKGTRLSECDAHVNGKCTESSHIRYGKSRMSTLPRLAKMQQLFKNDLQPDAYECLCLIYETLERATSILITNDIKD